MPRRDGRGPEGSGPMTGRGLGNCQDSESSDNNRNANPNRGLFRRQEQRRLFRNRRNRNQNY